MDRKLSIVVGGIVSLATLLPVATWVGRTAGREDGKRAIERVQLVWPSILSMPTEDRALVAALGMKCRVQDRPPVASEVIACLRDAAADPDTDLPKGVDRRAAQARLNELLRLHVHT
ncbi:hypothetical protein [Burkholderia territorii]|uniref:hypothetical protein n=1 Tax=Burkholderia territorii TaxID=1503055 RepID=UPI000AC2C8F4|nr:hypothetical protein [Burkholderia territorii]